jgi:hypothetical protein
MRRKDGRKTGERWSSLKGGNGGGVASKSGGVGGASVSQRGREVEEGGVTVCSSLDGKNWRGGERWQRRCSTVFKAVMAAWSSGGGGGEGPTWEHRVEEGEGGPTTARP